VNVKRYFTLLYTKLQHYYTSIGHHVNKNILEYLIMILVLPKIQPRPRRRVFGISGHSGVINI